MGRGSDAIKISFGRVESNPSGLRREFSVQVRGHYDETVLRTKRMKGIFFVFLVQPAQCNIS